MELSMNWINNKAFPPSPGMLIVKRWKNGAVWAGIYRGSEKEGSFEEYIVLDKLENV